MLYAMTTVSCRRCGAENAEGQRFCGACGASLLLPCPSCGEANPPAFRFCGSCGASLEPGAHEIPASTEERRWATVLFGDLSGFTRLSERMDPEDVRTLIDGCMDKLGAIVERYEGRVERVSGDEIMVVYGAPVGHEDDPERAVRTALEMQACAAEHTASFGGLPLRIGVNTGEMMFAPVGPEGARHHTVMGDAVNTASRLETAAPLNGVLVGPATYEATKNAIRYEPVDPIHAKGKEEPVSAWLALEVEAEPATRPISEVPMLGRDHELGFLRNLWERVVDDKRPHLVTVLGPPGIGKSKLAREFTASLAGAQALWGRSLPYAERAGGSFGQIVRQVADVYVTDDPETIRAKLADAVEATTGSSDDDLAAHLALMIGAGSQTDVNRATLFASARRFLDALGRAAPTVLVFEDIQWADPSLLELVQWLAARTDGPILFLALTRPELLDAQHGWGGGLGAYTALPLGPLSEASSRELARRLHSELDDATLERIRLAAGGNPLFVEELAAWLAEERDAGRPLPTTVTSMVAARLDALPPSLRQVLLDASVVGSGFWRGSLEPLHGARVDEALDELVARDLVRRQATSRLPGDEEYAFRHQVIRDVAYEILPRAVRRERHASIARYIEGRVGNTDIIAAILAHHWKDAGEDERAVDYFVKAAEVAGRGWEQLETIGLFKEALALVPDDDVARKRQITLKLAVARQIYTHAHLDATAIREHGGSLEDPHQH